MKTIHITSQDELPQVAGAIIGSLGRRTVVAFRGEMGAGKTTLIREIAAELGAADTVTSPTFAIVNQYKGEGNRRIHHFDFYRINDLREAFDFGYEEYFYSGDLCLVEWPEKIEQLLPDNTMTVRITVDSDTARTFEIDGSCPRAAPISPARFSKAPPRFRKALPLRNRIPGRTPQRFVPFVCRHRKNPYLCSGHNRRP